MTSLIGPHGHKELEVDILVKSLINGSLMFLTQFIIFMPSDLGLDPGNPSQDSLSEHRKHFSSPPHLSVLFFCCHKRI